MIHNAGTFNAARLVKVCYVYPQGHQFDGVFLDTGEYARCIQMASPYAGTDFGFTSGIPSPEREGYDENKDTRPDKRSVIAVVIPIATGYIGLGFLFPQVNHLAFDKNNHKDRLIERHPSDVYRTIDKDGNLEIVHPSGAHILISEHTDPTDLEGQDHDGLWKVRHNTDKDVTITLRTATVQIQIKPDGILIDAGNNPVDIKGSEVNVDCDMNVTGTVAVTSGDVTADGISLKTHVHGGVTTGGASTAPPS